MISSKKILLSPRFWYFSCAVAVGFVFFGRKPSPRSDDAIQKNDLLMAADVRAGSVLAQSCTACHNFTKDETEKKVGPDLFGIVGAPTGSKSGFRYSEALTTLNKLGHVWTTDHLYEWLRDPSSYAPGTTMTYSGMLDPQDRMDLIAYLITLK